MRIFLSVEHPAWAHQFRYLVDRLHSEGHQVRIVAIDKDGSCELLDKFGLNYTKLASGTGEGVLEKAWLLLSLTVKYFFAARSFKADLLIGRATPMMAITAFLLGKPHIIFEDTEHSYISLFFCKLFSTKIVTPNSFLRDLGAKQVRQPIYKESFYLHPNRFTPDPKVIERIGLTRDTPYVLLRFVSWHADHDLGQGGLTLETKKLAVTELAKVAKVFISSELPLDPFFAPYQINIPRDQIHSFVYFASLVYGESSTMASEAALLGTHAIFCDFEGRGYTTEQETKFGLVSNFKLDPDSQRRSVERAVQLLADPNLKQLGKEKRDHLLAETLDGTECLYGFLQQAGGLA